MIVIPQKVRDGFGNLLDPLALRLIRLHIRPNFITTIGTLVIVGSAVAFGLGRARWGGLLLLLSGLCDMVDGRVARRGGMATTFGGFYDSTPRRSTGSAERRCSQASRSISCAAASPPLASSWRSPRASSP